MRYVQRSWCDALGALRLTGCAALSALHSVLYGAIGALRFGLRCVRRRVFAGMHVLGTLDFDEPFLEIVCAGDIGKWGGICKKGPVSASCELASTGNHNYCGLTTGNFVNKACAHMCTCSMYGKQLSVLATFWYKCRSRWEAGRIFWEVWSHAACGFARPWWYMRLHGHWQLGWNLMANLRRKPPIGVTMAKWPPKSCVPLHGRLSHRWCENPPQQSVIP